MSDLRKVTAAKWSWRGDTGWVDYDAKMNLHIESEFLEGVTRISVDGERFVDVSLPPKQIRLKWYCADCEDKACIGLQRRIDDETKRRAVRREVAPFLKKLQVVLALSEDDVEFVTKMVQSHQGGVKDEVTRRTTVVVLGEGADEENEKISSALEAARTHGTPVVTEKWLVECFKQEQLLSDDFDTYAVAPKEEKEEEEIIKKKSANADVAEEDSDLAPPSSKKAKTSEIEDDEEESAPKAKKSSSSTTSKNSTSAAKKSSTSSSSMDVDATSSAPSASSAKSSLTAPKKTSGVRSACAIKSDSVWMGVSSTTSPEDSAGHVAFIFSVSSIVSGAIEGVMHWPTLQDAKLKVKGTIVAREMRFTEFEIIQGEEAVEPGAEYVVTVSDDGLSWSGTWELDISGDISLGTASANILPDSFDSLGISSKKSIASSSSQPSSSASDNTSSSSNLLGASIIAKNAKFNGVVEIQHEFEMKIEERDGNLVKGTLHWPLEQYISNFEGEVVGSQFKFTEISLNKHTGPAPIANPTFPSIYSGVLQYDGTSIDGSKGNGPKASFSIRI